MIVPPSHSRSPLARTGMLGIDGGVRFPANGVAPGHVVGDVAGHEVCHADGEHTRCRVGITGPNGCRLTLDLAGDLGETLTQTGHIPLVLILLRLGPKRELFIEGFGELSPDSSLKLPENRGDVSNLALGTLLEERLDIAGAIPHTGFKGTLERRQVL